MSLGPPTAFAECDTKNGNIQWLHAVLLITVKNPVTLLSGRLSMSSKNGTPIGAVLSLPVVVALGVDGIVRVELADTVFVAVDATTLPRKA